MNRLTEYRKDLKRYEYKQDERGYCFIQEGQIVNKLGKLEDLEEQLGCPLEVVFKALANGVYYEDVANCMKYMAVDLHLNLDGEYVLYFDDEEYLLTKNYKKTWWLKKDKSE